MTDRIDQYDLAMLRRAIDQIREPQAALRFVQEHIARKYTLTSADQVNAETGVIVRGERMPAEDPAEQ
jgi:hypothetical protein